MRQPRFRGFSTETKNWHYGHGWFEVDYTDEYLKEKGIKQQAMLYTDGYPVECELASMGESTGLKDKLGNEVYEGDIIYEWEDCAWYWVVKWDEKNACFYLHEQQIDEKFYSNEAIGVLAEGRVTGNIYENPELLESR